MTFFANTSWVNQPILDLGSGIADIYEYGCPIWYASPGDSTFAVTVGESTWGSAFGGMLVPIPAGATPSSGSDGWLNIVDLTARLNFSMWQYAWNNGKPSCSYGTVESLDGDPTKSVLNGWTGTGAGISSIALVGLISELQAGVIAHPLKFGHPATTSAFVSPATKSDGKQPFGIPMGTKIRLDPAVNLAAISGITPFELIVGKCLQRYGAFCTDTAAAFSFTFQTPTTQAQSPDWYTANGVSDFQSLPHIPWASVKILP